MKTVRVWLKDPQDQATIKRLFQIVRGLGRYRVCNFLLDELKMADGFGMMAARDAVALHGGSGQFQWEPREPK
jgi:hypothetical protein